MKALAAISTFVGKTFAVWVILFAVLGFFFPDTFKQIAPWIVTLLSIIMFGMGLTLSVDDFREVMKRPVDVTIGVLGQFLIMPLLAVLLTRIIPMPPEVAAGVILVGCCPGGTSSNVMTYLSKGDVALSVACTSVTTLAAPLVTPFLVWMFASQFLPVDGWAMFLSIVKVVLVPLALGAALQKVLPGVVKAAVPALPLVSVIGIVLIVSAVVGASKGAIAQSGLMIFAVVVLHNGLAICLATSQPRQQACRLPSERRSPLRLECRTPVSVRHSQLRISRLLRRFQAQSLASGTTFPVRFWRTGFRDVAMRVPAQTQFIARDFFVLGCCESPAQERPS